MSNAREEMTVKDAAEKLGVCPRRVVQLLASGELTGKRLTPRMWLVNPKSVERKMREPMPTTGRPRKVLEKSSK